MIRELIIGTSVVSGCLLGMCDDSSITNRRSAETSVSLIKPDVLCVVEAASVTRAANPITLGITLVLTNLENSAKNIVLKYYVAGTSKQPGFGLPPAIVLESSHKGEWISVGTSLTISTDSDGKFVLPPYGTKRLKVDVTLGEREAYKLEENLRIRLFGHKIEATSWTNSVVSVPFVIKKR
jgi:hypothetical protein